MWNNGADHEIPSAQLGSFTHTKESKSGSIMLIGRMWFWIHTYPIILDEPFYHTID
jgi:hypothetical protein